MIISLNYRSFIFAAWDRERVLEVVAAGDDILLVSFARVACAVSLQQRRYGTVTRLNFYRGRVIDVHIGL